MEGVGGQAGGGQAGQHGGRPGNGFDADTLRDGLGDQAVARVRDQGSAGVGDEGDLGAIPQLQEQVELARPLVVFMETNGGFVDAVVVQQLAVWRVSSQATRSTSRRMRRARKVMSSRLPMEWRRDRACRT